MKNLLSELSCCGSQIVVKYYLLLLGLMALVMWWSMGAAAGFDHCRLDGNPSSKKTKFRG